ncbi:MAG: SoxR reducing system RseC family protein [Flavobacteriaceae bacterium]|nr:SoxR reducing system RseC family protein [Bacteroidia bacterium]NNK88283.1 SoxR reducing system RseC family protein [Flavobacteriaceae bacterium]
MDSQFSHDTFIHPGKVSGVSGDSVIVTLDQNVHCDSCRIKSACGMSESRSKEIEVSNSAEPFSMNEDVNVVIRKDLGLKAVFWAYVFPFILLISVLLVSSIFLSEWQAGLLALGVLVPYYIMLHYLDSFFRKKFEISILKLT